MKLLQTLAASALAIALSVSAAEAYPHHGMGPRGGPGAHWREPPGRFAEPYRHSWWRYHHPYYYGWRRAFWGGRPYYWWPERRCWYDPFYYNPPGPIYDPGEGLVICRW